jgi:putative transposase
MVSLEKIAKQKQTLKETKQRRQSQICTCYNLKIIYDKCNQEQQVFLKQIFKEAKWFYNYLLSQENIFDCLELTKNKIIPVKTPAGIENREVKYISSQVRRALYDRLCNSIKALSILKKKDFKIGRLKFKPEINSVDYIQNKISWDIRGNKIKLQGCKKMFSVNGLDQIKKEYELANCKLIRKASGYYLQITTFQKESIKEKTGKQIGLDFGIKDSITTSDGDKYNFKIKETDKLKKLQLHEARKKKGSKNKNKIRHKINKLYEKTNNKKNDISNKFVSKLNKENDVIVIQDELISQWHKGIFGSQVQDGCLGRIKSKIKGLQSTIVIPSKVPTTKQCFCGFKNDIKLKDRVFKCAKCNFEMDRDEKSAKFILHYGMDKSILSGTDFYTCGENVRLKL